MIWQTRASVFLFLIILLPTQKGSAAPSGVRFYRGGEVALERGDYYRAIDQFKRAIRENPVYREALIGLCEAYFSLGEYEEALQYGERVLPLAKGNTHLAVLLARSHVGLGKYEEAKARFRDILKTLPNELGARLGLAEIALIEGKVEEAKALYKRGLALSLENRRALLSLMLLYDSVGEYDKGAFYVEQALHYYPHDVDVQLAAGWHYLRANKLLRAERILAEVSSDRVLLRDELGDLEAQIALRKGELLKAIATLRESLSRMPGDPMRWYRLGMAYEAQGEIDKAISALEAGLRADPHDEIARIALENLLLDRLPVEDSRRVRFAEKHRHEGKIFEKVHQYSMALSEYRRALLLAPLERDLWLGYTRLVRGTGQWGRYIAQLTFLEEQGLGNELIREHLILAKREQPRGLSEEWSVDQFSVARYPYVLSLYAEEGSWGQRHYRASSQLNRYMVDVLSQERTWDFNEIETLPSDLSYKRGREDGSDYFVVLQFRETQRTFSCRVRLFLSRTGGLLEDVSLLRTGNRRVVSALEEVGKIISSSVPVRGLILELSHKRMALVNLGARDGLEEGQILSVLKRRGEVLLATGPYFKPRNEEHFLGRVRVSRVDEEIAEGIVEEVSPPFQLVNRGDAVYAPPPRRSQGGATPTEGITPPVVRNLELKTQLLRMR